MLVCRQSPRWSPSRTRCSFVLIRCNGLLVRVASLPSFSLLANISYRFLIGSRSPRRPTAPTRRSFDLIFPDLHLDVWQKYRVRHWWPTSSTSCSFVPIRYTGPLVSIACLPSFSLLATISYWLLISPYSPHCPTSAMRCSFDLHFANLRSDMWQKHRVRHQWPTSRTSCSFVLIRRASLLLHIARLPSFSTLA